MGFYVSDKLEHRYGWPSFDFITAKKALYTVFPKQKVFKTWDEQERGTEDFRRKVWGLGKSPTLGEPFPAPVWQQNVKNFDVIPGPDVAGYKRNRAREEDEGDPQTNLFKQAVRVAMLSPRQQINVMKRELREQELKGGPRMKRPGIIPDKTKYKRVKKIDIE